MRSHSKVRPIDAGHVCPRCDSARVKVLEEHRPQDGGAIAVARKIKCRARQCRRTYHSNEYVAE